MNETYIGLVEENAPLLDDGSVFSLTVRLPAVARFARPGQIAHLDCGLTLRRPFAIAAADARTGLLRFCCDVRGEGTRRLAALKPGDRLSILGPFGHGWPDLTGKTVLAVGGGTGIYSLLPLAAAYGEKVTAALGFRSASRAVSLGDFEKAGASLRVATEDGSLGENGYVTTLADRLLDTGKFDAVCACGPHIMMQKAAASAAERGIPCYVSLEERMGCGVGACMGCVTKIRGKDGTAVLRRVCMDGPVFPAETVIWQDDPA